MIGKLVTKAMNVSTSLALSCVSEERATSLADRCLRARHRLQERARYLHSQRSQSEEIDGFTSADGKTLTRSILEKSAPWDAHPVAECSIPGMLTLAEKRYYDYIPQFYRGEGAVVEIGTWLGMSTFHLVTGLRKNGAFKEPLHCFDDYVWRATSQEKWLEGTDIVAPGNNESFQPIFEDEITRAGIRDDVQVHRMKLSEFDGNRDLPQFAWAGGPIEMLVVDCGRTLEVNEAWYSACESSFIPDRTLIVMQDWQQHKSVPEKPWENTKIFTDRKYDALEMIHEVRHAAIATFVYRGHPR